MVVFIIRSTPNHMLIKYRCPYYYFIGIRHVYLINGDTHIKLGITKLILDSIGVLVTSLVVQHTKNPHV